MNRLTRRIPLTCLMLTIMFLADGLIMMVHSDPQPETRIQRLRRVKTWMYQLQGINKDGAVAALANSRYDLLVIEPTNTVKGAEDWDSKGTVARLKAGHSNRLVLAYIDIGEAESYRTYWKENWQPPTKKKQGSPGFIITADPDGWEENYPVAFWDKHWYELVIDSRNSLLKKALADGYDGVYLDWVEAYDDNEVIKVARKAGINPARAMVDFILHLRQTARQQNAEFLVIAQNAPYLLDEDPRYAKAVDAVAFEDTWFRGKAEADWDAPHGGDHPNRHKGNYSTPSLLRQYQKYRQLGLPVFTCDYCLKEENAKKVYKASLKQDFIPLVTRVSLARLTTTPPPPFTSSPDGTPPTHQKQ